MCSRPKCDICGSILLSHKNKENHIVIWRCRSCKIRVPNNFETSSPKYELEVFQARKKVHEVIDPMWEKADPAVQEKLHQTIYAYIGKKLGLCGDVCHVKLFTVKQCNRIINFMKNLTLEDIWLFRYSRPSKFFGRERSLR